MALRFPRNSTLNYKAMEKHWSLISRNALTVGAVYGRARAPRSGAEMSKLQRAVIDRPYSKRLHRFRQNPHHGLIKLERFQ